MSSSAAMRSPPLSAFIYAAALERNRREVMPFRAVFDSCVSARKEHKEIMQFHAECRAQIGALLVDFQGHFKMRAEAAGMEDEYRAVKSRLSVINDLFSSRYRYQLFKYTILCVLINNNA
jgi:hypothetical protein